MGYFRCVPGKVSLLALLFFVSGCGPAPSPISTKASTPAAVLETPEMRRLKLPLEFPSVSLSAKVGDKVWLLDLNRLPRQGVYSARDRPQEIWGLATLTKVGPEASQVDGWVEVPNALLIPLPSRLVVTPGDRVLALSRAGRPVYATVTSAKDPTRPVATPVSKKATHAELEHFSGPLEPGTFLVVKDGFGPGARVFVDEVGIAMVVSVAGEQALVLGYRGPLAVANTGKLSPLPVTPSLKKGDQVRAPFYGTPLLAEVLEIDLEGRRVEVDYDSDYTPPEYVEFGEVEVLKQKQPWNPHTRLGRSRAMTSPPRVSREAP